MDGLADRLRTALDSGDLEAIAAVLADDARWGAPGAGADDCRGKADILAWWSRAKAAGAAATVTEVVEDGDHLVVGLQVTGPPALAAGAEAVGRWQTLTVRDGLVADVRGVDTREEAVALAGW